MLNLDTQKIYTHIYTHTYTKTNSPRCIIPLECKKFSPDNMSSIYFLNKGSDKGPVVHQQPHIMINWTYQWNIIYLCGLPNSFKISFNEPSEAWSRKILRVDFVNSAPRYLMILGWSRVLKICISTEQLNYDIQNEFTKTFINTIDERVSHAVPYLAWLWLAQYAP